MRRIEAVVLRTATTTSLSVLPFLGVASGLWIVARSHFLCVEPWGTIALDFRLQLGLMATLGVTAFVWVTLHALGFVGVGTGAGFRLAALALAARMSVSLLLAITGGETGGSIYDNLPEVTGPVWWVRHLSLIAYGCGFALVVLASTTDIVRRRTARWATFED